MFHEIRAAFARSADTALEDALGAVILFTHLCAGLCLPSVF